MNVFVILYDPGYGDPPYVKGVFTNRDEARKAMKEDATYARSREGIDYELDKYKLNELS